MIYVTQNGRCGNQMFLYAFARKLQLSRNNDAISMDFSHLGSGLGEFWGDSLKLFNTVAYETLDGANAINSFGTGKQKRAAWVMSKLNAVVMGHPREKIQQYMDQHIFRLFSKYGIYFSRSGFTCDYAISKDRNVFVSGLYESSGFFDSIRPTLINEFSPREELSEDTKNLLGMIEKTNSICVSFRNWNIDVDDAVIKNRRTICDFDYYKRAFEVIKSRVSDPVFFVFSDDVDWGMSIAKEILGDDFLVVAESGKDNVAAKMKLMSSCKHFVLTNSTFCWWAQYLCQNTDKIVVSPNKWLKIKNRSSLISDQWILL